MLTHTESQQISRAEAVSLQKRFTLDCTICAEQGYPHKDECDLDCKYYEKWAGED